MAAEAQKRSRTTTFSQENLSLYDWIPVASPGFTRPNHFGGELEDDLNAILRGERRYITLSAPPQHGKSYTSCFHMGVRYMQKWPERTLAYLTYGAQLSQDRNLQNFIPIVDRVGIKTPVRSQERWFTAQGGSFRALGIGGPLTGFPLDFAIIDDPYKDREEAESEVTRSKVWDWFNGVLMPRSGPRPHFSVIVTHTRWHDDDLIGRLRKDRSGRWKHYNFPAINENGQQLWEAVALEDLLAAKERSEFDWWSMYMGEPRPRGMGVFRQNSNTYAALPDKKLTYAVGLDLAYTAKTYSDWSVAILLAMDKSTKDVFVVDMIRYKLTAPEFIVKLKEFLGEHSWPSVFSYVGGVEKGITDFFTTQGVKVRAEPAKADKFVRAQPFATAWNNGRVYLPESAPWVDTLKSELSVFTGIGDTHDDQVDALAGAFAQLTIPPPARGVGQQRLFPF